LFYAFLHTHLSTVICFKTYLKKERHEISVDNRYILSLGNPIKSTYQWIQRCWHDHESHKTIGSRSRIKRPILLFLFLLKCSPTINVNLSMNEFRLGIFLNNQGCRNINGDFWFIFWWEMRPWYIGSAISAILYKLFRSNLSFWIRNHIRNDCGPLIRMLECVLWAYSELKAWWYCIVLLASFVYKINTVFL
jgi:hypothetical protein